VGECNKGTPSRHKNRIFFGSGRNSGEGGADFEEEVFVIAVAAGHPLEDLDLVVVAFEQPLCKGQRQ
jgi:hypothetical protein